MIPTILYVEGVFYDALEDKIFLATIPIHEIDCEFYNELDNNINDLKRIKFKGGILNTAQGILLLGSL